MSEIAIRARNVSKAYRLHDSPGDRLLDLFGKSLAVDLPRAVFPHEIDRVPDARRILHLDGRLVAIDAFVAKFGAFLVFRKQRFAADNIVHGLLGLWGLASLRSQRAAILFARAMAGIFAALTLGGFVPAAGDVLPLYGNDIWLHALLAAISAYFGWIHHVSA